MRSPLTGVLFALELTHDTNALLPLLVATAFAHAFSVLVMKRSILTEKVARRGYHVSREYTVDPLERLSLGEVMSDDVVAVPGATPIGELLNRYFLAHGPGRHQGYPVVDDTGKLLGMITRANLLEHWVAAALQGVRDAAPSAHDPIIAYDLVAREPITAFPWESCRTAAERMAQTGWVVFPSSLRTIRSA
jgi:chloride channel protein, CIC family